MKKIIKSRLFIVIITTIIVASGTLYAANKYQASEVIYNASDGTSTTVNRTLDDLYSIKETLDNINGLGDATNNDIVEGKTAVVKGNLITGTGVNAISGNKSERLFFGFTGVNTNRTDKISCGDYPGYNLFVYLGINTSGGGSSKNIPISGDADILSDTGYVEIFAGTSYRMVIFRLQEGQYLSGTSKYNHFYGIK